jgi:hypothetical protein
MTRVGHSLQAALLYCQIQDSNATGGATWDALSPTNTNLGNNSGWIFPISNNNAAFMQFF